MFFNIVNLLDIMRTVVKPLGEDFTNEKLMQYFEEYKLTILIFAFKIFFLGVSFLIFFSFHPR